MGQRDRVAAVGCLIAVVMLVGCKQNNPNAPARVTGKVTYNGSPVTGGNVYFHTKDGGAIAAPIGGDSVQGLNAMRPSLRSGAGCAATGFGGPAVFSGCRCCKAR